MIIIGEGRGGLPIKKKLFRGWGGDVAISVTSTINIEGHFPPPPPQKKTKKQQQQQQQQQQPGSRDRLP